MTSSACCNAGPPLVGGDYVEKGTFSEVQDSRGSIPIYTVGPSTPARKEKENVSGILLLPDIFGFCEINRNIFRIADRLAEWGYFVLLIDPFRGKPWTHDRERFPPPPAQNIKEWIATHDDQEADVLSLCQKFLQDRGCHRCATIGFCWGASRALHAMTSVPNYYLCSLSFHPSNVAPEDVAAVEGPVMFCPCKDDQSLEPIADAIKDKQWAHDCILQRFDDMSHGFMTARGDWSDIAVGKRVEDAFSMMQTFLRKHLG
jgi:dienelactone hydrolase